MTVRQIRAGMIPLAPMHQEFAARVTIFLYISYPAMCGQQQEASHSAEIDPLGHFVELRMKYVQVALALMDFVLILKRLLAIYVPLTMIV
mmetsp:Transcript_8890/g.18510  ORF Transcript_8890/g.18510 Transcript_8890/m.18510 type:complete len:90 (-) Transcript_8890:119-388(-)